MSFRRLALPETGFDERFRFGAEDLDMCLRLRLGYPGTHLVVTPHAKVKHHFLPTLHDTLRRSRSYGRGGARLYRKWPSMRPTIFPGPALMIALLLTSVFFPIVLAVAVLLPHFMYPKGLRLAVARRRPASLIDAYVQLAQETYGNVGYLKGLWEYRSLLPEPAGATADAPEMRSNIPAGISP